MYAETEKQPAVEVANNARPTRENGRETRRRLTDAAVQLLAEGGESAVTISSAAKRAGITRRAVYYHFDNVSELIAAAHEALTEKFFAALKKSRAPTEPGTLLMVLADQHESILRSQVYKILENGLQHNDVYKTILSSHIESQEAGEITNDMDVEMFAVATTSMAFFGTLAALSLAKTKAERRTIAKRYVLEMDRLVHHRSYRDKDHFK